MFERILIGVDFTPCSDLALEVARTHFPGAQRRLVHAAPLLPTMTSALSICLNRPPGMTTVWSETGRIWTTCGWPTRRRSSPGDTRPRRCWPRPWRGARI